MKKIPAIIIALACVSSLLPMRCANPNAGNGSDVGNARITAMLYNPGGTPAANAKVCFYPHDNDPRPGKGTGPVDSTTTDASGNYTAKLDSGTYNILASLGNNATFQDSIKAVRDSTVHPPVDTLKALGSISGKIELQGTDDPRTVFILFMGSNTFATVNDIQGNFSATNMAKGKYRVRILTTLDNYKVMDTAFEITAEKDSVISEPIQLEYTGIPVVQGLRIAYDTMKQIVTLTWNKPTTGRAVQSYTIYRKRSDSTNFVSIKGGVTDTSYNDSTGVQDQTYEYRVVVVDKNATEGTKSATANVTFVSSFFLLDSVPHLKPVDRFAIGSDSMFYSVYIGDNFVRVFNKFGDSVGIIGSGDLSYASDIAIDSRNHIYAVASNGIFKYSSNGKALSHWTITEPSRVTIDENDFLYIIYNYRHSIAKLDTAGTFLDSATVQSAEEIVSVVNMGIFIGDGECYCVRILDTNLVQKSTIELQINGIGSPIVIAADANGRLYVREVVSFGSQGILEIHIFDSLGVRVGKFQPHRGGNDLSVSGSNTLYLIDRDLGLSIYRLPF
jgi:hypothetical protein